MDQTEDENINSTVEIIEKLACKRSSPRRIKSDSKTPSKRKSRNVGTCQSENRVRKNRKRGKVALRTVNDFAIELLTEQLNTPQQSLAKDSDKMWQTCFVNLEQLTPNKLELVKTVSSPLLQIKNEISNLNEAKSVDTKAEDECIIDDSLSLLENNDICGDDNTVNVIEEKTLNETFTLPSDESTNEITENVFNFDNEKDQYKSIQTTSPPLFSSLLEKATSKDEVPKNRSSIVKKLSKTMKPVKSQKLSSNSKISKSFRLSSVTSGRTPKISGSKAVQLYEFLTDEPKQNDQTNSIDSPPSGSSTPAILKKRVINNLLKNTLKRQNNVTFEDVPEETKMNVSRVKMPNFALIHQKRFEKMESISDYQSRKSERAKLLLSGGKLPVNSSNQSPKLKNETIRKELIGSFNKPSNVSVFPSSPRVQLVSPWRVCNKGILKDTNQNLPDANPQEKKVRITLASDKSLDTSATGITMRKTPFKATSTKSPLVLDINQKPPTNLFKSPVKKTQISNAKTSSRKDQIKPLPSKKVGQEGSACNFKPKALKENLLPKEKTGHTRFGFRVPVKISKNEIVKAVTNKTKLATSSCDMEDKRAVIKGVRSNRRFDLLMQMRLKK